MPYELSTLLESEVDATSYVDENSLISSVTDETQLKQAKPVKRAKKRKCVTMPKRKPVVIAASSTADRSAKAERKRKAVQPEDEDDLVEVQVRKSQDEQKKPRSVKEAPVKKRGRPAQKREDMIEEVEEEEILETAQSNFAHVQPRSARPTAERPTKKPRVEESAQKPRPNTISESATGDATLRKRLGDITRKCENIDLKYRNLKQLGIYEANANVEKLRKQCENITDASSKLVASLRREIASQEPSLEAARKHEHKARVLEEESKNLRQENKDVMVKLAAAQSEIKALQAQLSSAKAAARAVSVPAQIDSRIPVVTKAQSVPPKPLIQSMNGNETVQLSQLKVDLYGDLTGLIIRGVKNTDEGQTYDCIQTGRNGTLHFKLFIDSEEAKNNSFEDTEFVYTPLLDANRDHDLIDVMPAYLTEDITFARANAAKFYQRVQETLTKRIEPQETETT